jgi:hypothetical protein
MANTTYRDQDFKIDNASAALTSIKAYLNQVDFDRALDLIEDTAMSDTNRSYLHGLGGTTFTISGMVNTTTDAIFGPLVAVESLYRPLLQRRNPDDKRKVFRFNQQPANLLRLPDGRRRSKQDKRRLVESV